MNDIETNQNHTSTTYDEQQGKITQILEDNKKIHKENTLLQNTVKNLKEELKSEKKIEPTKSIYPLFKDG